MEELLTVEEVAKHFKVAPQTVYGWVHRGIIHHKKLKSGQVRFTKKNLEEFEVEDGVITNKAE